MTVSWPSTLPSLPTVNGFAWKPQDNRIAFAPDVGPSISRKRSTAAGALATALFTLTAVQVDAFEWWFRKVINDGVDQFLFKHPRTQALELWKFAPGQPYEIAALGNGYYSLTCNLMWMPGNRGLSVLTETQTILTALSTQPANALKYAMDDAVRNLIYNDIWNDLDVLQIYATQAQADALLNWKAPGTFNASLSGTNTFTAYQGIAGDGTTGYINTGFNPTVAAGKYALNDAHVGAWLKSSGAANSYEIGGAVGFGGNVYVQSRTTGDRAAGRINDASPLNVTGVIDGSGHIGMNRSSSSARQMFRNGALAGSDTQASTSIPFGNLASLFYNNIYSAKQVAAFHCGRSMSATKWAALEAILRTFMTAASAIT